MGFKEEYQKFCKKKTREFFRQLHISKYALYFQDSHPFVSVDVYDNVDLSNKNLSEIHFKFRNVIGDFNCSNCNLTSLDFAPKYVGGNFDCSNNKLTSLNNAPDFVGGNFDCSGNQELQSWGNKSLCIVGNLYCSDNNLLPPLPEADYTNKESNLKHETNNQIFEIRGNISIQGEITNESPRKKSFYKIREENKKEQKIDLAKRSLLENMIVQNIIPRYLYKYRQLTQEKVMNIHTKKIITDNELFFSNPADFNDPYDCTIPIHSNLSEEEIKKRSESLGLSENHFLIEFMKNHSDFIKLSMLKKIENIGVCCFSSLYDSILMWSHYADFHRGICFKFDILEDPDFFLEPLVVKYTKIQPGCYFLKKDQKKEIERFAQRKFTDWSYESEVRILKSKEEITYNKKPTDKDDDHARIFTFNDKALVEIIFGNNTSDEDIKIVKKLCKTCGKEHVKFSQMELDEKVVMLKTKTLCTQKITMNSGFITGCTRSR